MIIPQNYDAWKHCITHDCNIELTNEFVNKRLEVYSNILDPQTIKFIKLYGEKHHQQIIQWYQQAAKEIESLQKF